MLAILIMDTQHLHNIFAMSTSSQKTTQQGSQLAHLYQTTLFLI